MRVIFLYIFLLIIFLACSAFFSGMEAAIFSLSRFRIKSLIFEERRGARLLERIKKSPGKTLAAILLANLLVNIGASSIGALIVLRLINTYQVNSVIAFILQFIIMTSLLLLIGEITPKTVAIAHAENYALRYGPIIAFVSELFSPLSGILEKLTRRIMGHRTNTEHTSVSDKEIRLMLKEAMEYRILDPGEERFGYQILKFGKVAVNEIMTPRQKVAKINMNASLDRAIKTIKSKSHSRICVMDTHENIAGILYAKDVFLQRLAEPLHTSKTISQLMREPYIIHETKSAENLLAEFRKKGIHIAVVVDEYGDFTGIVTLEDILESLYGEIIDEYDEYGELSDVPYQKISTDTYMFEGDISIGELIRIIDIEPFADEGERLSGFIMEYFKRIPLEDEIIKTESFEMKVVEVHDRLISKVLVKKIQ